MTDHSPTLDRRRLAVRETGPLLLMPVVVVVVAMALMQFPKPGT